MWRSEVSQHWTSAKEVPARHARRGPSDVSQRHLLHGQRSNTARIPWWHQYVMIPTRVLLRCFNMCCLFQRVVSTVVDMMKCISLFVLYFLTESCYAFSYRIILLCDFSMRRTLLASLPKRRQLQVLNITCRFVCGQHHGNTRHQVHCWSGFLESSPASSQTNERRPEKCVWRRHVQESYIHPSSGLY